MSPLAAIDFKLFEDALIPISGTVDLAPLLVMVSLLTAGAVLMHVRPRRQFMRRVIQTASFSAFVIGLHPCACMVRDLVRGSLVLNYDNLQAFWLTMLIVPLAAFTMVWGRVFCGWVCPIGFVQEAGSKVTGWMRRHPDRERMKRIRFTLAAVLLLGTISLYAFVRTDNFPILQGLGAGYLIALTVLIMLSVADRRWEARLRVVRYVSLAFFVGFTALGVYLNAAFCVLFSRILDSTTVMLFVGVLLASLVLSQAWCRFLCPEGALLGLLTRLSGYKITLNRGRCSGCNVCNDVCPVEAIDVGEVDERSCLYCCKCLDACPTDAIEMAAPPERGHVMHLPVVS
jgi:polyferredoxin